MIDLLKEYLPQIIASVIIIFLTPSSKYIIRKVVWKYGEITLKSEPRILQITQVINILINFTCLIILAIIWGVQPQNMLVALSSIFAVIGVAMFAQWSILSNIIRFVRIKIFYIIIGAEVPMNFFNCFTHN